ncbi:MAG: cell division protein ZapA [Nitrospirota bacterium]
MDSVQVEIFGHTYSIKGRDNPAYIRELAAFLDAKMQEVQKATGTVDPHRVAILTALTFADELHALKKDLTALTQSADTRTNQLLDITEQIDNDHISRL